MTDKKWPWTVWVVVGVLSAAGIVGAWKLWSSADQASETGRITRTRHAARQPVTIPDADPTDLQALERRLLAAGRLRDDPEKRDLITAEVAEALIMFHGEPGPQPPAPATVPNAESAKPYDLAALRAGLDEALATKDTQLRGLELGAVAEFLAANDPELAAKWVEELLVPGAANPSFDAYAFTSVFAEAYAKVGLNEAVAWADGLSNDSLRLITHQYIAREWALRDIGSVEAWIASSGDAGERSNIIRAIDNAFRTGGDATSSAWAERLAADSRDGPRHSDVVVRHWAKADLDAAINWASSLPAADDVVRAVDGLAEAFASKNPAAATQWAASFPNGPVKDRALTLTAVYWAHFEPQEAARWLQSFAQPSVLESTAPGVYATLLTKDPAGADLWLDSLSIRPEFRDYVRSLNAHVAADPNR